MGPHITVLMPVYNAEQYIGEAIESILTQTYSDFEFLIIDDGSTDKSIEIIQQFHDPRIRIVTNDTNEKLSATLNKGIQLAQCEFIARMDADDISLPTRLEEQIAFMQTHPTVALCGTWYEVFGGGKKKIMRPPLHHHDIQCFALFNSPFCHPSVLFRKSVFLKRDLKFDTHVPTAEDYQCWVRLIQNEHTANIPKVLLRYRVHNQQMTQTLVDRNRGVVGKIHSVQIEMLGITPTERELHIHYLTGNEMLEGDLTYLKECHQWLMKLFEANEQKHIYDGNAFSALLSHHWFRTCSAVTFLGTNVYFEYWKAPAYLLKNNKLYKRIVFLIKCVISWDKYSIHARFKKLFALV